MSDLVRNLLVVVTENAHRVRPSDIIDAVNGDFAAWERLIVSASDDDWASVVEPDPSIPRGTIFASRSDLLEAERSDRDFLKEKLNDIDRRQRALRIEQALATLHPENSAIDQERRRERQAAWRQLAEEERDVLTALQKYSVVPRASLIQNANQPAPTAEADKMQMGVGDESPTAPPETAHVSGIPQRSRRRFRIRVEEMSQDESDEILRKVLEMDNLRLDARTIGKRLGADRGDRDIPPGTVKHWRQTARKMREAGEI